jgi:hypothetical protein
MNLTLDEMLLHLAEVTIAIRHETHEALTHAAQIVQREAQQELGTYQGAAGPFAAWAELADATKEERVALGFSENDPGVRTGEMRDSIQYSVGTGADWQQANVGSDDPKMVYFELGTMTQPPRSALGGAAFRRAPEIAHALGEAAVRALVGPHTRIRIP